MIFLDIFVSLLELLSIELIKIKIKNNIKILN